ncbi:uncharacterized protein G2W53_037992 [Senna tora]|uniref:Uncharacterized protein n=1 Tax=Senna tora TaxID=362788 RepID=A0A834SLR3_9FABA|nr:uncharacterized protein G2W53_037992 [Senna tora]
MSISSSIEGSSSGGGSKWGDSLHCTVRLLDFCSFSGSLQALFTIDPLLLSQFLSYGDFSRPWGDFSGHMEICQNHTGISPKVLMCDFYDHSTYLDHVGTTQDDQGFGHASHELKQSIPSLPLLFPFLNGNLSVLNFTYPTLVRDKLSIFQFTPWPLQSNQFTFFHVFYQHLLPTDFTIFNYVDVLGHYAHYQLTLFLFCLLCQFLFLDLHLLVSLTVSQLEQLGIEAVLFCIWQSLHNMLLQRHPCDASVAHGKLTSCQKLENLTHPLPGLSMLMLQTLQSSLILTPIIVKTNNNDQNQTKCCLVGK